MESVPQKINSQLIQAAHPGEILGGHYTFYDTTVQRSNTYVYYVEVVPISGDPYLSHPLQVTVGHQIFMPFITH